MGNTSFYTQYNEILHGYCKSFLAPVKGFDTETRDAPLRLHKINARVTGTCFASSEDMAHTIMKTRWLMLAFLVAGTVEAQDTLPAGQARGPYPYPRFLLGSSVGASTDKVLLLRGQLTMLRGDRPVVLQLTGGTYPIGDDRTYSFTEIGLLTGRAWKSRHVRTTLAAGLSYTSQRYAKDEDASIKVHHLIGVPLQAELLWTPGQHFGVGFGIGTTLRKLSPGTSAFLTV